MVKFFLGLLYAGVLLPLATIWRGYVLHVMWAWFIVSTFSVPALGVVQAIGVSAIVSFLTYQKPPKEEEKDTLITLFESLIQSVISTTMFLGIGWVIHQFA